MCTFSTTCGSVWRFACTPSMITISHFVESAILLWNFPTFELAARPGCAALLKISRVRAAAAQLNPLCAHSTVTNDGGALFRKFRAELQFGAGGVKNLSRVWPKPEGVRPGGWNLHGRRVIDSVPFHISRGHLLVAHRFNNNTFVAHPIDRLT